MNQHRVLEEVLDYGREIFGKQFPRDHKDGMQWLAQAAHHGDPLPTHLLEPGSIVSVDQGYAIPETTASSLDRSFHASTRAAS
jgi:hypothetical protein